MFGFPLMHSRLRQFPPVGTIPIFGCGVESYDRKAVDEMESDVECHDSREGFVNQIVVTPGQSRAKECDFNIFNAAFGHAHESMLKPTARSTGVRVYEQTC